MVLFPLRNIFGALSQVHFIHTIYRFEAWEVRSPTLQTVSKSELKRKSYGHCKKTAELKENFALCESRCETPSWHMSGISYSPNQFSHGVKQLAKFFSSAKQLPKVGELAKQLPKKRINLRKSIQVAKIQNPNSHGYCSWCEMVSQSANHPLYHTSAITSCSETDWHGANSSAKIKTWCENFAP